MTRLKRQPIVRRAYRIKELGDILGLSRATIYRLIDRGALRIITLPGGMRLIDAASVEEVLSGKAEAKPRRVGKKIPVE